MQDLRMRCDWAGLKPEVADQLVVYYGKERLDALVDAVWIVGLHLRTKGTLPPGNTLGERARNAAAALPMAAMSNAVWGDLP
jgi:hypothetical protein